MKELCNVIEFDGSFVDCDDEGGGWVGDKGVCTAIMKELRNVIEFDGSFVGLDDEGGASQWWVGNEGACMAIMKELRNVVEFNGSFVGLDSEASEASQWQMWVGDAASRVAKEVLVLACGSKSNVH